MMGIRRRATEAAARRRGMRAADQPLPLETELRRAAEQRLRPGMERRRAVQALTPVAGLAVVRVRAARQLEVGLRAPVNSAANSAVTPRAALWES